MVVHATVYNISLFKKDAYHYYLIILGLLSLIGACYCPVQVSKVLLLLVSPKVDLTFFGRSLKNPNIKVGTEVLQSSGSSSKQLQDILKSALKLCVT